MGMRVGWEVATRSSGQASKERGRCYRETSESLARAKGVGHEELIGTREMLV